MDTYGIFTYIRLFFYGKWIQIYHAGKSYGIQKGYVEWIWMFCCICLSFFGLLEVRQGKRLLRCFAETRRTERFQSFGFCIRMEVGHRSSFPSLRQFRLEISMTFQKRTMWETLRSIVNLSNYLIHLGRNSLFGNGGSNARKNTTGVFGLVATNEETKLQGSSSWSGWNRHSILDLNLGPVEFKTDTNKQTLFERIDVDIFQSNMVQLSISKFSEMCIISFMIYILGILHPDFRRWWFPGDFFCGPLIS